MSTQSQRLGIVVGVDGTSSSTRAADWAAREAAGRAGQLTLVNVVPTVAPSGWLDAPMAEDYWGEREQRGREHLDDALAAAGRILGDHATVRVRTMMVHDEPVPGLVSLSKEADLVVVGCRGLGALPGILLGSVSRGLVHHAHCPVAVIHDEDPSTDRPDKAPVVVGVDGSPASLSAVEIAFDAASRRGVDLVVVHTYSDDDSLMDPMDWDELESVGGEVLSERLAGWQERYPDVAVRRVLKRSNPAKSIVEQSKAAQLVVVGSHGRGGFAGMLLGSVSTSVVHAAHVPVIVARPA